MFNTPKLDPNYMGTQLVDGNNYLFNRFQADSGGLIIRNIVADIRACARPPVFVFDGLNGDDRRRKLVPEYKVRTAKALKARESMWPMLKLFRSLMPFLPCVTINVPTWEADDVLATLAKPPCRVITTDRDLSQLSVTPDVEVTAKFSDVPPDQVRLYKTFCGDASDNIKGVHLFGQKSWEVLNKDRAPSFEFGRWSAEQLGMKESHHTWCLFNTDKLKAYWEIIGLLEVPMDQIVANMIVGAPNPDRINAILKEFML